MSRTDYDAALRRRGYAQQDFAAGTLWQRAHAKLLLEKILLLKTLSADERKWLEDGKVDICIN